MKKKLLNYLSLVILLGSFFVSPITAIGENETTINQASSETTTSSSNTIEKDSLERSQEVIKNSTDISADSEKKELSQSTSESKEDDASEESQPRAPTSDTEKSYGREDRKAYVQPRAAKASRVIDNIVKSITMTDGQGNPIKSIGRNDTLTIDFKFELPNNKANEGDTSVIQLPRELRLIRDQDFNITDSSGSVVAKAHVNMEDKTITLIYTKFVEQHSNVKGSFYVATRIDTEVVTHEKNLVFNFSVNGKSIEGGRGHYTGKGDSATDRFNKVSRFAKDNSRFIQYQVRINPFDRSYKNVVVKDVLQSDALSYDKTSFKIEKGVWRLDSKGRLYLGNSVDVTNQFPINFVDGDRGWNVRLGDLQEDEGYAISYYGILNRDPLEGETFTNLAEMFSNEQRVDLTNRQTVYQSAGGKGEGEVFSIRLLKKSQSGQLLPNAKFEVTRVSSNQVIGTYISDARGVVTIDKLLKDSYIIKEIEAPKGYEVLEKPIYVTFDEFESKKEIQKEVVNKPIETTSIHGQKTWNDSDDQDGKRPKFIKVNLLANGTVVNSKEVRAADGWKYEFTNLPKYENGQEIVYTITEDQVPDYNTEIHGFDITNSYTPGKTSVSVTKAWNDQNNQDGLRPNSVQVQLYANGKEVGSPVELMEANQWRHTWNDLPEKVNGQTIKYTVKEVTAVTGYTSSVDDSDLGNVTITNTHTPEVTKIAGQKTWKDSDDQDGKRPEKINVNLLANGTVVDSKKVRAADGWKYEFTNLPKYENGQEIVYTITEDQVPDYNTEIHGFDITNSYTPGKTSVSVTKAWNDQNNQDGLRPNSVQAQLYANGKEVGSPVELMEANQWRHTWNDLPEKVNGQTIKYTVKEVTAITGYTSKVDDSDLGNVRIINTHIPEKVQTPKVKKKNSKFLPQTGESRNNLLLALGVIILAGVIVSFYKKKNS